METCINYANSKLAYFSSDENKWIKRIRELNIKKPNEVKIIAQPEENDGCIYAQIPAYYLRISPKREVSDKQREAAKERMQRLVSKRKEERYGSIEN